MKEKKQNKEINTKTKVLKLIFYSLGWLILGFGLGILLTAIMYYV